MTIFDYEQLYNEMVESYSICFKGLKYANEAAARRLELLRRVDKGMENMYRLKIVYPASLGDLWTDIVKELKDDND